MPASRTVTSTDASRTPLSSDARSSTWLRTSASGVEADRRPEPAVPAAPTPRRAATAPSGSPRPDGPPGRVPVYAVWHPEVGPLLGISASTVSSYVRDIYRKLGISSRAEAAMEAARRGLVA